MKSEFDKAEQLYEKLLQNDETQAEAYWGLILCKYGMNMWRALSPSSVYPPAIELPSNRSVPARTTALPYPTPTPYNARYTKQKPKRSIACKRRSLHYPKRKSPMMCTPVLPTDTDTAPTTEDTWTCICGKSGITSRFCPDCGQARPEKEAGWDCVCGKKSITSRFCPECGAKKPEVSAWSCKCGKKGITSKFCPDCGNQKED